MFLDTIYLDLSDSKSTPVGPGGPILGDFTADAGMRLKLYDVGGAYRVSEPQAGVQFDLLGGLRYIVIDVRALLTLPGPGMDQVDIRTGPSETDLLVGARASGVTPRKPTSRCQDQFWDSFSNSEVSSWRYSH